MIWRMFVQDQAIIVFGTDNINTYISLLPMFWPVATKFCGFSNPTSGHTHQGNQIWKRHVYPNVHHSTVYHSQDMEAT